MNKQNIIKAIAIFLLLALFVSCSSTSNYYRSQSRCRARWCR